MKKKELEILLQKVPSYDKPNPSLEQYVTPAGIVADIIFIAHQFGDIKDKVVMDLGCGTGIFSIGASITGAKRAIGIDVDEKAIEIAKTYSKEISQDITFIVQDINDIELKCDTVLMNPPFGAQKSNIKADRKFIEVGFKSASVVYSLHLTKTFDFLKKMISSMGGEINYSKNYNFPIKHLYEFHRKKQVNYDVMLLRIIKKQK